MKRKIIIKLSISLLAVAMLSGCGRSGLDESIALGSAGEEAPVEAVTEVIVKETGAAEETEAIEEVATELSTEEETEAASEKGNEELLAEVFPLAMSGFSNFEDHGDYFTIHTAILENYYMERGQFDAMAMGDTVNILGDSFTKTEFSDGYDSLVCLDRGDGKYFIPGSTYGEEEYRLSGIYAFLVPDGWDEVLLTADSVEGFYNGTEDPKQIVADYELKIRKDAEIQTFASYTEVGGSVLADAAFGSGEVPDSGIMQADYQNRTLKAWLFFDEEGYVNGLMELFAP